MSRKKGKIHIGTSGWHYKHWKEIFYPKGMKEPQFLEYYLKFFSTVEINNSFYRLPPGETFQHWKEAVPEKFLFAVKGSRFITHMKKLSDPVASLDGFLTNVRHLGDRLGVILFQLPPGWKLNAERLNAFAAALPKDFRYAFEFRNQTWYDESVYEILRSYNLAFCIYEIEHHLSPVITTANFVYVRLHGPEGKYAGNYSDSVLRNWAHKCIYWSEQGKDVFLYFDNDQLAYAAFNAIRIKELLKEKL